MATEKPKLAVYWASACGGCEIAVVNIHEKILELDAALDLVFCPCLMDTKKKDVEAMPDKSLAITLFNGAIRTDENAEMARLLRKKSRLLVAFGSCAAWGGIPGLSNLGTAADHMRAAYLENPSTENPMGTLPHTETAVPEGTLRLPAFHERVKTLSQVVPVDYFIPGCPPESRQIWNVVETILGGSPLPPPGSGLGCTATTVCSECARPKNEKSIAAVIRTATSQPREDLCLLEQGFVCMGAATRGGCGGLCPNVNMPCAGCYGPPEGSTDQGARMTAALGSIIEAGIATPEQDLPGVLDAPLEDLPDPAGSFYKFALPGSLLRGKRP